VGYPVPPLAGLDKEKEKTHPYTTKSGAPAKATSKARQRDPQRQLPNQEGFFAALRGCDFFDFLQKVMLKAIALRAGNSFFRNLVTTSQNDCQKPKDKKLAGAVRKLTRCDKGGAAKEAWRVC
jgi:hypothetical protein